MNLTRNQEEVKLELQIAPLIDVVFLLLMCRAFFRMHALEHYAGATFLLVSFLALFPLSSTLSMYSFPTGGLAWPALATALGCHFRRY